MIWSIIPEDMIFIDTHLDYQKSKKELRNYLGRQVMVIKDETGERIVSVLSSDPADFMDMRLRPGSYISKTR